MPPARFPRAVHPLVSSPPFVLFRFPFETRVDFAQRPPTASPILATFFCSGRRGEGRGRGGVKKEKNEARDKFVTRAGPDRDFEDARYRLQILEKILLLLFLFFFFCSFFVTGDLGLLARVEYRFWVSFVLRDYYFFFFLFWRLKNWQ